MRVWNVFKMELFKNVHDRVNLIIMLAFMVINIIGGIIMSNQGWRQVPNAFESMMIQLFSFSVMGTAIFLFLYPYRIARMDYRNKVMSLLIASGVSRVQYYFVKTGATLLFSLLSIILLVILPLLIVLISHDMSMVLEFFQFWSFVIDASIISVILFGWLSAFSMLMTAVIISKGKHYTIFVFLGFTILSSMFVPLLLPALGGLWWQAGGTAILIVQHLVTAVVMSLIGILILRRQNL